MRHVAVGVAAASGVYVLLWEASQPVTATHFMLVLGKFDPHVAAMISPFVFALVLTLFGIVLGMISVRERRSYATWGWFFVADIAAPVIALLGHG